MRGRTPDAFELSKPDERRIRTLLRNGDTPLRVARRARMLLDRAQGSRPSAVVRTVDQNLYDRLASVCPLPSRGSVCSVV